LAFSSDCEFLFAGTTSGDVAVVLMKNRVIQHFVHVCSAGVNALVVIPESQGFARLVVGGGDGSATVLSGPTPLDVREERNIKLDGSVASLSRSTDASHLFAVTTQGTSFMLRSKDLAVQVHNQVSPGALYNVAYMTGSSDLFLTCCGDGVVTLWDANDYSAKLKCSVRTQAQPWSVAACEDIMVLGCSDGRLLSFDCAQGQSLWHIDNAHRGGVPTVQLASNFRFVVSGGHEGEVRVWEVKTRDMVSHLKEHTARVNQVELFPNAQYAISCSRDRCLLTWDLRQQKRLTAHRERHGGINCLAVAENQTTVYTAGQEKTLTTWDLRIGDPVQVQSLDEELNSISLSPDNRYIAMAGTGMTVKVWDVHANAIVSSGSGHSRPIQRLAFSQDGRQLVSVGLDHAALVWNFYT